MMGESSAPALDYATDGRSRRRRIRIVGTTIVLLVFSLVAVVHHYRKQISDQVQRWYWMRQCLKHQTPADTVMTEWNQARIQQLLRSNPDYAPWPRSANSPGRPPAAAEYVPRALQKLLPFTVGTSSFDNLGSGIVFLGERRSPSGNRRLVVIYGSVKNALSLDSAGIAHEVYTPPSLFNGAALRAAPRSRGGTRAPFFPATLSPAVADPNNPAHLTIAFRVDPGGEKPERTGILDVHLRDDDALTFTVRDPATTRGL